MGSEYSRARRFCGLAVLRYLESLERAMRFELTTPTLASEELRCLRIKRD
jgi:hypothetical protein